MTSPSKVHENNLFLSTLVNNLPGMAYRCLNDEDWTMEFVSEGCFNLTGYQPSHLIQNQKVSYGQLINAEDAKRVWNEVQAALRGKKPFHTTYRIKTAAGEEKWVWEQGTGIFSPEGKLLALQGFISDITIQRKNEYDLGERIKELNCLYGINRLAQKQDLTLEEIVQKTVALIPPAWHYPEITCARIILKDKEFRTDNFKESAWKQSSDIIVHQKQVGTIEVYYLEEKPESEEGLFLEDEKALIDAIANQVGIITEHKQSDMAIKNSEERFRTLIENSLSGFSIIQGGKVVYQNPEQERLLGPLPRSPKFMDNENIYSDDIEKVKKYYKEISSDNPSIQDLDFRFYPKDKKKNYQELIWVHCRSAPIEYQGEKSILTNLTDITPIKQIEHLLRIQDKMESLGRIASGVAHEIRNPLSGVNVFLDGIRENFEDPENAEDIKELIDQAKSASGKIESIVKRVLDFSRPSLPKFELKDINIPIKEAIHLSHVSLRKAGIEIERNLSDEILQVHIDAQLIEQVLLNMITNAAEALKDIQGRKAIAIASTMEKDSVFISIGDSGPGVEPDIREKIFDPFYTTRTQGSGIGLSICQRIISDHGGLIEVSKSELGGAEFIIKIPQQSA